MSRGPERAPIDHYLDRICRRLWFVSARERRDTREELRQHLIALAVHAARTVSATEATEDAMEKFGDPKQIAHDLSRQHLRRRRWLSALLKTAAGVGLTLLVLVVGYSGYWYFALSKPMEREPAPTPIASAAATLVAIQAAHDGYARQIQSVRFQSQQAIHEYYQGHGDRMTTHTYQVASKGNWYYSSEALDNRPIYGPAPTVPEYDVHVSNGKILREMTERDSTADRLHGSKTYDNIVYLRDNRYKPHDPDEVLQYGYKVHGVWIGDMLRRGEPSVEGTVADVKFGPLTVVRCRNRARWGADEAVRLWLSPALGWLAVRTEVLDRGARPPLTARMVYEAQNVIRSGAFWVANAGHLRYGAVGLGRRQEIGDNPQRFTEIVFNDVPDAQFVTSFHAGTRMRSSDFQKDYVLQPSGQWKEEPGEFASSSGPQWPLILGGIVVLGSAGFAMLRVRRRGTRLTA